VEGRRIQAYLGLVFGEAIVGANLLRDLFAQVRDIVRGRSFGGPGRRPWRRPLAAWARTPW